MKYDLIVIGAGLYGSIVAHEIARQGKRVLVLERRSHIGGNCWTRNEDGINVHEYGAHIFRTSSKDIWDFVCKFADFNHFVNSPIANYHGRLYNLPFNMNTFYQIWGVTTPSQVRAKIEEQRREVVGEPKNLEEKAISLVGRDVYEILIKEYTEKQWGRSCAELPASIIRRLPVRLIFDNNYFNDPYQGIPIGGYTQIFEKLLSRCEVRCSMLVDKSALTSMLAPGGRVLWTGPIDEYFDYCYGPLEYRSLKFEHERHTETDNFQGNAVFNYCDLSVPYTRTIEHKHFEFGNQSFTIVSKEYSIEWTPGKEPYYPINNDVNQRRYLQYVELAQGLQFLKFGGRLGLYRYTDMQDTIISALAVSKDLFN